MLFLCTKCVSNLYKTTLIVYCTTYGTNYILFGKVLLFSVLELGKKKNIIMLLYIVVFSSVKIPMNHVQ